MQFLKCSVITLRRDGLRIPRKEWPMALLGELVSDPAPKGGGPARADLWVSLGTTNRRIQLTLFNPTFEGVVADGFLLAGHEMRAETVDGVQRVSEHRQVWMVTPLADF